MPPARNATDTHSRFATVWFAMFHAPKSRNPGLHHHEPDHKRHRREHAEKLHGDCRDARVAHCGAGGFGGVGGGSAPAAPREQPHRQPHERGGNREDGHVEQQVGREVDDVGERALVGERQREALEHGCGQNDSRPLLDERDVLAPPEADRLPSPGGENERRRCGHGAGSGGPQTVSEPPALPQPSDHDDQDESRKERERGVGLHREQRRRERARERETAGRSGRGTVLGKRNGHNRRGHHRYRERSRRVVHEERDRGAPERAHSGELLVVVRAEHERHEHDRDAQQRGLEAPDQRRRDHPHAREERHSYQRQPEPEVRRDDRYAGSREQLREHRVERGVVRLAGQPRDVGSVLRGDPAVDELLDRGEVVHEVVVAKQADRTRPDGDPVGGLRRRGEDHEQARRVELGDPGAGRAPLRRDRRGAVCRCLRHGLHEPRARGPQPQGRVPRDRRRSPPRTRPRRAARA